MKRILVSMFMLFLVSTTFAQVYVRVNVGYNFFMNSALLMVDDDYNSLLGIWNFLGVYGSYGNLDKYLKGFMFLMTNYNHCLLSEELSL